LLCIASAGAPFAQPSAGAHLKHAHDGGAVSERRPVVYIIDDDSIILWMFQEFLQGIGAEFRTFSSAREFLDAYRPGAHECLITDVRMPEIGGLQVQRELLERGNDLPIIFVSGYPEVHSAVEAMKRGAFDFLEKPVKGSVLVEKVQAALARSREIHVERLRRSARDARLALLTPKERQIAAMVVAGKSSPKIAEELDISVRTVENHRSRLMEKLHVDSAVELVKLFL
jgi:FixJ family two-component response regulator